MAYEYGSSVPPAYEDAMIIADNRLGAIQNPTAVGRQPSAFDVRLDYHNADQVRASFIDQLLPAADRYKFIWDELYDRQSVRTALKLQKEEREDNKKLVITGLLRHDIDPEDGWRLALRMQNYQTIGPEEHATDAQYDIETSGGMVVRAVKRAKVARSFYQIDRNRFGGSGEVRHVRFHEFAKPLEAYNCEYVLDQLQFVYTAYRARVESKTA